MDLRHLRYFIAVAEEGHVTRAAERLGIQQPPLSQLIKTIERELDVKLFRRKPRGVELTDAGRAFFDDARSIFLQLDQSFEKTRRIARGEQGQITVGIASTAHFHPFVPRVIRMYREAFPQVLLTLEEGATSDLLSQVRSERVDVGFIRMPFSDTRDLVFNPLFEEKMVVALPSQHVLAQRWKAVDAPIPFKALSEETFILYRRSDGPGLPEVVIAACHATGFSPHFGQNAPRPASALNLVAAGFGITIIPAALRRMHLDGVVYRSLKGPTQPKAPLNLVSRRLDPSAAIQQFVKFVRRGAKDYIASHEPQ